MLILSKHAGDKLTVWTQLRTGRRRVFRSRAILVLDYWLIEEKLNASAPTIRPPADAF
jgi:hypothetical protein